MGTCLLFLCAGLAVPTNPEHSLPLAPEALAAFSICILGLVVPKREETKKIGPYWIPSLLLVNHLLILTPRALYSLYSNQKGCMTVGSLFMKIECYLQSGGLLNWSLRSYLYTSTALFIFLGAYYITSSSHQVRKIFLLVPLYAYGLVLGAELYSGATNTESALPLFLGQIEYSGIRKFGSWFTNYGWLWPYLAPAVALSGWLSFGHHSRSRRVVGFLLSISLLFTALINGQRGFYLILVMSVVLGIAYRYQTVWKSKTLKPRTYKLANLRISLSALLLCIFVVYSQQILQFLERFGLHLRKSPLTLSYERLTIWKEALALILEKPFLGYGYASWYPTVFQAKVQNRFTLVYDTAHNWFVQTILELGIFHFLFLSFIFANIAFRAFLNLKDIRSGRLLFAIFFTVTIATAMVQEVDYIRPTYYLFAFYWGALSSTPVGNIWSKNLWRNIGALCIILFLIAVALLSRGGFAFEGNDIAGGRVERWTRQNFSMVVSQRKGPTYYTIFPVASPAQPNHLKIIGPGTKIDLPVVNQDQAWTLLPLKNPAIGLRRYSVRVARKSNLDTRDFGLHMAFPAWQSTLALAPLKGITLDMGNSNRWNIYCEKECEFLVQSCQSQKKVDFVIANISPLAITLQISGGEQKSLAADSKMAVIIPLHGHEFERVGIETTGKIEIEEPSCHSDD